MKVFDGRIQLGGGRDRRILLKIWAAGLAAAFAHGYNNRIAERSEKIHVAAAARDEIGGNRPRPC